MFSNIGWSEMVILLVAALVILGPERLPGAVRWTTRSLRQVRDYASGATSQLREELGPEFDDLRKPLADLNELRGMTPRAMVTKHLLNGDDSLLRNLDSALPDPKDLYSTNSGMPDYPMPKLDKPLDRNERPPIDTDAT
ncbi:Sec-independent protein translocase subunit TatB [Nocardia beijingensis]|uniref:Sec-independent protein translocase protein TatB n=1 Tax=Nocardia beijingensis TaxID=95162 RepID=UPI00189390E5|nr:Sec-independent protein translocase protein TatB [Nocardia beijingensis]MBF6466427.1 Sec-independent protein translocase subunit TatB [Nocardia beijingensis]